MAYTFYDKQYDYNDLARDADAGLMSYLNTIKRGDSDYTEFLNAYNDLMSGIKDGSIIVTDGRFHDSKGRYKNSDKKNKDYYGIMANYIYGKMGLSKEIEKPVDKSKIKWDLDSIRKALYNELFNSDTVKLLDFLDLDTDKDGKRELTNRATYLKNALNDILTNFDNKFQGYTEQDKQRYTTLLNTAINAISDGKIDNGDYLALSNAANGVDFRTLLSTVGTSKTNSDTTASGTTSGITSDGSVNGEGTLNYKFKSASLANTFNLDIINKVSTVMQKVPSTGLINILRNSLYNRNYRFGKDPRIVKIFKTNVNTKLGLTATLNALYRLGHLRVADDKHPNLLYIPGLNTKYGTSWIWDRSNNTITEVSSDKIPYIINKKKQQVTSNKQGGVLKFADGSKVYNPYEGLLEYNDPNTQYKSNWDFTNIYGINDKGVYGTAYGNNGAGSISSRYKTDKNYSDYSTKGKNYATAVEANQAYRDFTNALVASAAEYMNASDKNTMLNNLFYQWAKKVDSSLPTGSKASFFDKDGNLRTSWTLNNKDAYGRKSTKSPYKNLAAYVQAIRNDQLLGNRHNDFMRKGIRYYYKDANGVKHYVADNFDRNKYKVSDAATTTTIGNTNWSDYEITPTSFGEGSDVNRTEGKKKTPFDPNKLKEFVPDALSIARYANTIATNNRIADSLKDAVHPDLINPYELYSPVVGAFGTKQAYNLLAANIQRNANTVETSDAMLNALKSANGSINAADVRMQGALKDNEIISETAKEALARQEKNIALRNAVATNNIKEINNAIAKTAEIEANRQKTNLDSSNSLIATKEAELRQKQALAEADKRNEEKRYKATKLTLSNEQFLRPWDIKRKKLENDFKFEMQRVSNEFENNKANYRKINGEDALYTNTDWYKDYLQKIKDLQWKYYEDQQKLESEAILAQFDYLAQLRKNNPLLKNGGKLSYSSLQMIKKTIK